MTKRETKQPHRLSSRIWRRLLRIHRWFDRHPVLRITRKVVVGTFGIIFVLGGMVTGPFVPGPQGLIVALGLALLASEFVWARLALRRGQLTVHRTARRISGHRFKSLWRWKKWLRRKYGNHEAVDPGA